MSLLYREESALTRKNNCTKTTRLIPKFTSEFIASMINIEPVPVDRLITFVSAPIEVIYTDQVIPGLFQEPIYG